VAFVNEPSNIWEPVSAATPEPVSGQVKDEEAQPLPAGKDLPDWAQYQFTLEASRAAKLGFPVGSVGASTSDRVMIREFSRSIQRKHANPDREVRYGVALRLVVEVANLEADAKFDLAWLAAQVELNNKSASARLDISGFVDEQIGDLLPPIGHDQFNVDSYVKMMQSLTDIQKLIASKPDGIVPAALQRIRIAPESEDDWTTDMVRSVGVSWALSQVARGKSCQQAKKSLWSGGLESTLRQRERAVEDTYARILGRSPCGPTRPKAAHQERAREILEPYVLKDEWPPGP
jgi:hypothetical protein